MAPSRKRLAFTLLHLVAIAVLWYGIVWLVLAWQRTFIPASAFLYGGTRLGAIFTHVTPFFVSIALVGLLSARTAQQARPSELKTAPRIFLAAGTVFLSVLITATGNYFYLTDQGVAYRPTLLSHVRQYAWSDVSGIQAACWYSRGTPEQSYALTMTDGTRIDILDGQPDFLGAYSQLSAGLRGHSIRFEQHGCDGIVNRRWARAMLESPANPVR